MRGCAREKEGGGEMKSCFHVAAQSKAELVSCVGVILQGPWQSKRVDDG